MSRLSFKDDDTGVIHIVSSDNPLPTSATLSGGGDASAANQDEQTVLLTDILTSSQSNDALSGVEFNTTLPTLTDGQKDNAQSDNRARQFVKNIHIDSSGQEIDYTQDVGPLLGAVDETAPASDTASSGHSGRLQRIAQRITSLIALLPTALTTLGSLKISVEETSIDDYETVAASQTDQILGATGAVGDFLSHVTIIPATTAAGTVSIKDGNGSAINIFVAGTLSNLVPFTVVWGAKCLAGTTPGWKITTSTNVSAIGFGRFT